MSLTEWGLGGFSRNGRWKERGEERWRRRPLGCAGEVCEKIVWVHCKVCAKH